MGKNKYADVFTGRLFEGIQNLFGVQPDVI
jgi:hypothetical protein